ncbi:MAG TPA: hypothetical protein VGD99_09585 [Anaerolineae bacterium]|jgi:hypothetical protein
MIVLNVAFAAVHRVIGLLIFARKSDDWVALFVALMLVTFGLATFSDPLRWLALGHAAWWLPIQLVRFIGDISFLIFCYTFPSGLFVPRWTQLVAAIWIITEIPNYFLPDSPFNSDAWPFVIAVLVFIAFIGTGLFAQTYRYRRVSNARQRQQTKWVVFGVALTLGGFLGVVLLILIIPSLEQNVLSKVAVNTSFPLFMLLIPLSIGIAMLRSGLWDIDRLINRTMVYGTLSVALVGVYGGSVALLQQLFRGLTGQTSQLAVVVATLAIAALFNPLRRRVQDVIDRRFYRRKYDAAQTLADFSMTLRNEVDLANLTSGLASVVGETMQPTHVSLWLKEQKWFSIDRQEIS